MNVIYKSRENGEFAVVYYVYAHEGTSSKGGFHGTHGTPSRSATASPDLADVKLPRAWPKTVEAKLYPVDIVEEEEDRVKVHYIGYDSAHDE